MNSQKGMGGGGMVEEYVTDFYTLKLMHRPWFTDIRKFCD